MVGDEGIGWNRVGKRCLARGERETSPKLKRDDHRSLLPVEENASTHEYRKSRSPYSTS